MLFAQSFIFSVIIELASAVPSLSVPRGAPGFDFGNKPVRGVNIGGWLVLEPWITPSIFESLDQKLGIIDEYTLGEKLGGAADKILRNHWDTWCTFSDFKKIRDSGFNTVRIPIGYWAYARADGEPYRQGAAPYIDAAIDWARALNLKIWIDLHGAPGSQNGFDNSGHKVQTPGWQKGDTVAQTLKVLKIMTSKYAQPKYHDVIVAIELLNEPLGPVLNFNVLKQFYRDGFFQTRDMGTTTVVLHDAFFNTDRWNGFLTPSDHNAQYVVVDHHEYQVFTPELNALQPSQHRQLVCNNVPNWQGGADKWVVVGEWTGAMTDCAKYLNGYKVGARYDGTFPGSKRVGSCSGQSNIKSWTTQHRNDMRWYIEAQLDTYEKKANGWIWWNFKTLGAGEWDAFALIDAGIFPQPLTARKFSPACR